MKKTPITDRYTLADLEKWREVDPPIRLGVFGDPVAHSLSPQMQNAALRACKIDMQYARFHIRPNELRSALLLLRDLDFVGTNLTVPHKIAAFAQIDEADDHARRVGAVNTFGCRNKKLIGSNTDGQGFLRALRSEFSVDVRDLRVMILGAGGGTGCAIAWQCALENCERLVLINRTLEKSKDASRKAATIFCRTARAWPGGAARGRPVGGIGITRTNGGCRSYRERNSDRDESGRSRTDSCATARPASHDL